MKKPFYLFYKHQFLLVVLLSSTLLSCSNKVEDRTYGMTENEIQQLAQKELVNENYKEALDLFEKLQARYPLGKNAIQAQLQMAYIHYKKGELSAAISTLDKFQKAYPKHTQTDYALYLRGLVYLSENNDIFSHIHKQDPSERDSIGQQKAFDAWKQLVERFPSSPYAKDVEPKLNGILRDLVKNEIHIARYYAKKGAWVAAVNRAKFALETYPLIPEHEQALEILLEGYQQLGFNDLYKNTQAILAKNFPNNPNNSTNNSTSQPH
jgi:outer membrane protein assembly factor BamD